MGARKRREYERTVQSSRLLELYPKEVHDVYGKVMPKRSRSAAHASSYRSLTDNLPRLGIGESCVDLPLKEILLLPCQPLQRADGQVWLSEVRIQLDGLKPPMRNTTATEQRVNAVIYSQHGPCDGPESHDVMTLTATSLAVGIRR